MWRGRGRTWVNGAPMGFTWAEDFTGASTNGTRIDVTSTLNEKHRAALGLDTSPYVEGKTTIVAAFVGSGGKIQKAKLYAEEPERFCLDVP